MNTKLLRKIRKRFSWKRAYDGMTNCELYIVTDHQEQNVRKVLGFSRLINELIFDNVGYFTYVEWCKTRSKRIRRALYLKSLKPTDPI